MNTATYFDIARSTADKLHCWKWNLISNNAMYTFLLKCSEKLAWRWPCKVETCSSIDILQNVVVFGGHLFLSFLICVSYNSRHEHRLFSDTVKPTDICYGEATCFLWGRSGIYTIRETSWFCGFDRLSKMTITTAEIHQSLETEIIHRHVTLNSGFTEESDLCSCCFYVTLRDSGSPFT